MKTTKKFLFTKYHRFNGEVKPHATQSTLSSLIAFPPHLHCRCWSSFFVGVGVSRRHGGGRWGARASPKFYFLACLFCFSLFLFAGFADGGHSCSSEKEGFRLFELFLFVCNRSLFFQKG